MPDQHLVMIPSPKLLRVSPNLGSLPPSHFAGLLCLWKTNRLSVSSGSVTGRNLFFFPQEDPEWKVALRK